MFRLMIFNIFKVSLFYETLNMSHFKNRNIPFVSVFDAKPF